MHVLGLGGQDGAKIEQLMLHPAQNGHQRRNGFTGRDRGHADESVQFVDGAVALDARRILGDTLPAGQVGLALIAGLGVDAVQRQARLVESGSGTGGSPASIVP